ncbi:MAG TPA: MerR family transcriptional regulator [Micropepsaceae bacterium]
MSVLSAQKSPEAFRTISEVAMELDVPQHVLRFWETRFANIKPLKRGGGRRYYRPDDLDLLRGIRALLYRDGLTIKGVQKILREQGARYVMELGRGTVSLITVSPKATAAPAASKADGRSNVHPFSRESGGAPGLSKAERARFSMLIDELLDLKTRLSFARQMQASR